MTSAAIIGSGPNGLVAAVTLARAGLDVTVFEAADTPGGGCRTEELTLPGFWHDWGSAVHPMVATSPFFHAFELTKRVPYAVPELSYAHALAPGSTALAHRDLDRTVEGLGADGVRWRRIFEPLVSRLEPVLNLISAPLGNAPAHPVLAARLGLSVLAASPIGEATLGLRTEPARALFAGVAAHGNGATRSLALSAVGLILAAHGHGPQGWPVPIGGAGAVTAALLTDLEAHGGRVLTGVRITHAREIAGFDAVIFDTSARDLAQIAGNALPEKYRRSLRAFRYGNGSAKVDFALSEPVPWLDPALREAPTVHIGESARAIARAEREVSRGRMPEEPYVLITQPSILDPGRAPAGKAALWAYVHVPAGSALDPTEIITARIERLAPGFRDTILASVHTTAAQIEERNPSMIGGDIGTGATNLRQLLARPVFAREPWRTPVPGLYLGSASIPPGPGVHGRGGFAAARAALTDLGIALPDLGPGA
ncbi:NAD(P)/FAD-dependent oxidoreductase [Mycetocola tolaasinivorans]|uniref:NAD(P)/FAD-dependent oxidoreductase n=1 Tax=Mycetocola tolaasinivorans TaxID=76635 RepID=A0A3L7A1L0_9MICO|nr:NAD(P)/FAD-dependent oxidoreductase [Mycetocola tolaasinivorans]RLP74109.1 NAD(P)/FAD-dependent oxidoreductase [Mycetocola tolaasinivorans]